MKETGIHRVNRAKEVFLEERGSEPVGSDYIDNRESKQAIPIGEEYTRRSRSTYKGF